MRHSLHRRGPRSIGSVAVTSAGYSGTPLPKKLGIKPGHRLVLLAAPDGFELGELAEDVKVVRRAQGEADVIVSFHTARADLERRLPRLRELMRPAAGLWIAWPKRAAKMPTDLTEDVVRELGLANRLVDNKVAALDATWSGLRLVIRLKDRM
jgi:putative intracellular protease/amidase